MLENRGKVIHHYHIHQIVRVRQARSPCLLHGGQPVEILRLDMLSSLFNRGRVQGQAMHEEFAVPSQFHHQFSVAAPQVDAKSPFGPGRFKDLLGKRLGVCGHELATANNRQGT